MFWQRSEKSAKVEQVKEKTARWVTGCPVWSYMHDEQGVDGEVLAHLKQVECDGVLGDKPVTLIRIFDPTMAKEKDVAISSYEDLGNHPELILYEGYYYKTQRRKYEFHIEKKQEYVAKVTKK